MSDINSIKEDVLKERDLKKFKIIKKWVDGATKECIRIEYGDFGAAVINAEEYKMRQKELGGIEFVEKIFPPTKS
ncbi:hypothetical protein [Cetobacterium sp.]|uniref:hypothetical protein n=1 Tax=Cetobacterium sp. TaxID=2071632 RepID=UPI003EE631EB